MTIPLTYPEILNHDHPGALAAGGYATTKTNSTASPVTAALIQTQFAAVTDTTTYAKAWGNANLYIPVIGEAGAPDVVALPTAADLGIIGVVVGRDHSSPKAATFDSRLFDASQISNVGEPVLLSVKPKGCGMVCIAEYTGTAPSTDPAATTQLRHVVTSATAGKVATPTTAAIADSFGCTVIEVDTTNALVAYAL